MKRLCQLLVVIMACAVARAQQGNNQANIGGLLIASNFAQWTVPQGNQGGYSWSSPDFCKVTFAGVTFNAFSNGTPVQIVDTGNPGNSETVTVVKFHSQVNGCSIQVNPTHVHNTFFFRSSTGGLGEAMAFAGTQLYQVILTPDWTKLGGNTGLVTSQAGNTNVTIMDQRSAVLTPYLWSGSAYVAQPFSGGGGPPTGAATGVLSGFYPGPGLASSGALPNGWTVTTQSSGDNSGKAASTAYADAAGARFPGSNGIVFNTSAIASRNAVANDFNAIYGYTPLSPSYFGTLPGCGTAGFVFTPASANCLAAAGGTPAGPPAAVQFDNAGSFGGDSTFTFDNSTKTLGFQNGTIGPLGTANSGANFNSGILSLCGSYFNVIPLAACFTLQDTVTTGTTPYSVIQFGFTSPGGGQFNMPFTNFLDGFIQQGFNSGGVVFQAWPDSGNYEIFWPPQNPLSGSTFFSCAPIDATHCRGNWVAGGGGAGSVTPQSFGGLGDAVSVANGCTTSGTTTVVCPAGPFVVGDVGKEIDIWGAGTAGVSFKANITAFTSNTTVTVSATPPTNVTQNPTIFGHDDAAAIQACWNASSVNGVQCVMGTVTPSSFLTPSGYLVSSAGLTIPTHANITGNSFYEGTTIFGEFNGDTVSLPTSTSSVGAGQPIVGVNFANIEIYEDPTLANTRGIHLNAAAGVFGPGGIYASTFSNIMVENAAKECLWSDGSVTGADLPNQVLTFNMFYCNLPNQMHTAAAINITGSHAQIIFQNGQINGSTTHSNEPNPLISFTGSGGKFPVDVKFIGYTCEVATTCLYFGPNTSNLHYDNGYMEQVDNALIADTSAQGWTFNGNYLPNVGNNGSGGGAVAQFLGGVTGAMRDNTTAGAIPTVWATCSGATNVVIQSGNHSSNLQTSGCALSIAVSGGTQNANSCSADTNITMPGITTDSVVTVGYGSASEAGVTGWGTTGGMRILARPSATNTMSWHLCNPTPSNITYGAYTFKWGFTQQ